MILIFVFKAGLQAVFWGQAAVSVIEAIVVLMILRRSNWAVFAREAQERQGVAKPADEESTPVEEREGLHDSVISMQEPSSKKKIGPSLASSENSSTSVRRPEGEGA